MRSTAYLLFDQSKLQLSKDDIHATGEIAEPKTQLPLMYSSNELAANWYMSVRIWYATVWIISLRSRGKSVL